MMDIKLEPGVYVVAVSGGVDSMVLLDLLIKQNQAAVKKEIRGSSRATSEFVRLVVAHFDHGIRPDSWLDRQLVQQMVARLGLPFVYGTGNLGPGASEALARQARYEFLHRVRVASGARAIITAHHQDDALETAIINLLRGTGRRGLASLKNQADLLRPLLSYTKKHLQDYAKTHGIEWREDSTNADTRLLRNLVRQKIMSQLTAKQRKEFVEHIAKIYALNQEIDMEIAKILAQLTKQSKTQSTKLNRQAFIALPHAVATEVMAAWLRGQNLAFDRKSVERLVVAAKTYPVNKKADIDAGHYLIVHKTGIMLAVR